MRPVGEVADGETLGAEPVLDGAVLVGAVLEGAVLVGAVLEGAVLDGAVVAVRVADGRLVDVAGPAAPPLLFPLPRLSSSPRGFSSCCGVGSAARSRGGVRSATQRVTPTASSGRISRQPGWINRARCRVRPSGCRRPSLSR
ncbi:pentapeptide repeat-containing protein [Kineosporia sp. NBRC 101677]|uniref:pentapeptide repeat-containing protein n=1 Tax=Kineosporia TaxID=49184 RepID=UPI003321A6E3